MLELRCLSIYSSTGIKFADSEETFPLGKKREKRYFARLWQASVLGACAPVVRSVEIFPYQAKQFFVERLRFHEVGGFIDRQITDRRDIQIEVHPEVFHFTRAFRAP